jgi:single-strand DNA-binding protein
MAFSINRWQGIGNVGQQPEVKYTQGGQAVANFNVACSEKWKDKQSGEMKERTEWVRVVCFGKLAEICGEQLDKGARVYVEGRLQTREYEKDNVKRQITEIVAENAVFFGKRGEATAPTGSGSAPQPAPVTSREPYATRATTKPAPQKPVPTPPVDFGTPDYTHGSDDIPF